MYPEEALELGGAHVVVKGDGDVVWAKVLADLVRGTAQAMYDGGRVREYFLHAGVEDLPLVGAVEIVAHEEAATQQVIAQLRGLRVGEVPVADTSFAAFR